MILYLDASALVKRYVTEPGSIEVDQAINHAKAVGTALISRAEVVAALAKAVRMRALTDEDAQNSAQVFRNEWLDLIRLPITEMVVARADAFAWNHNLRGYDAVHLAAASVWQDALGERVTMATFDRRLWSVARDIGMGAHPLDLPAMLEQWKIGPKLIQGARGFLEGIQTDVGRESGGERDDSDE